MSTQGDDSRPLVEAPAEAGAHERLLTPEEVAELLQVKLSWIYSKVRKSELPHINVGRYVRFERDAIEAWIAENRDA